MSQLEGDGAQKPNTEISQTAGQSDTINDHAVTLMWRADIPKNIPQETNAAEVNKQLEEGKEPFHYGVNVRHVDGRPFVVYVPEGVNLSELSQQPTPPEQSEHKNPGLVLFANGVDEAKKATPENQWYIWGEVHGAREITEQAGNYAAAVLIPQMKIAGAFTSWNFPQAATDYYPGDVNDTKYALDVADYMHKHGFGTSSNTYGIGLSEGAQLLHSLVEQRPEVPQKPVLNGVAMFASGVTVNEPQIKPGVSLFLERSYGDPLGLDGGLHVNALLPGNFLPRPFSSGNRGWETAALDGLDPTNRHLSLRSQPRLQEWSALVQNGMDPNAKQNLEGVVNGGNGQPLFYRTVWGPNPEGVTIVRDAINPPYTGHYFPGSTDDPTKNFWSKPTPRNLYNGSYQSVRFFGLINSGVNDANVTMQPIPPGQPKPE